MLFRGTPCASAMRFVKCELRRGGHEIPVPEARDFSTELAGENARARLLSVRSPGR